MKSEPSANKTTQSAREALDAHPAGIRYALWVIVIGVLAALMPYHHEDMEAWRVIQNWDDLPCANILSTVPHTWSEVWNSVRREDFTTLSDDALLARAMSNAPNNEAPTPTVAVSESDTSNLATEQPVLESAAPPVRTRISPREFGRLRSDIDDPHDSLHRFYAQLDRVTQGEQTVARISMFSTSINGADRTSSQLRHLLQQRFGDGGKGWIPLAAGWRYQRHQDIRWEYEGWDTQIINHGAPGESRYGWGGVLAVATGPAHTLIETLARSRHSSSNLSNVRIFYQAHPRGGQLDLEVPGGETRMLNTYADEVVDRTFDVPVPNGARTLHIRSQPERSDQSTHVYGLTVENSGPGVVVDGIAFIGGFTRVLTHWPVTHLAEQIHKREPHLVIFWMGGNEATANSYRFSSGHYTRTYRQGIRNFKHAAPSLSCLVISVLDKGIRGPNGIQTLERVPMMVEAQERAAMEEGCAFLNLFEAAGGEGSVERWTQTTPPLISPDLAHLTRSGSRVIGSIIYRALLKDYDSWLSAPTGASTAQRNANASD